MKFNPKSAALATLALGAVLPASANVMIDDFTSGAQNMQISSGTSYLTAQAFGNMSGGQRDVQIGMNENPFNRSMSFDVVPGQGMAFLASGSGVKGVLELEYDGIDTEGSNGLTQGPGMNLDLSSQSAFQFDFAFSDTPVNIRVEAMSYHTGGPVSYSSANFTTTSSSGASSYLLNFSSLGNNVNGGVNLHDVDRLLFTFNPTNGAPDFAIKSVQAVPEPTSMAAIGFGIIGLARRRRNKKA